MNRLHFVSRLVAALLICLSFANLGGTTLASDGKVRGTVNYEKILDRNPETGVGGLQLDAPVLRPVAGARVAHPHRRAARGAEMM